MRTRPSPCGNWTRAASTPRATTSSRCAWGPARSRPPLPGLDLPGIHVLRRISDMDAIKTIVDCRQRASRRGGEGHRPAAAVVVGAGYIGLEMAENLIHRGAKVDVVEMADQILPAAGPGDVHPAWSTTSASRGVKLHLSTAVAAFAVDPAGGLKVELNNNTILGADTRHPLPPASGQRTDLAKAIGLEIGERGWHHGRHPHAAPPIPTSTLPATSWRPPHTVLPGAPAGPAGPGVRLNRQARVAAENICGPRHRVPLDPGHSRS